MEGGVNSQDAMNHGMKPLDCREYGIRIDCRNSCKVGILAGGVWLEQ